MVLLLPVRSRIFRSLIKFMLTSIEILNGSDVPMYNDSNQINSTEIRCPYSEESAPETHLKLSGCSGDKMNKLIESYPNFIGYFWSKIIGFFAIEKRKFNEVERFIQSIDIDSIELLYTNAKFSRNRFIFQ